jgi:hypothetical protein
MKRVFLLIAILSAWAFGYNYSGTWVNKSATNYNDPVKLVITGTKVKPFIRRGEDSAALKVKNATNVGSGLFEAWGHGGKNLILFIKPINSYKLRVIAKKIDVNRKKILTKSFIFAKKGAVTVSMKKRFVGNYKGGNSFSAINKLSIRLVDGQLFVRAWKRRNGTLVPLGVARAKLYNNRLHITWNKGGLVVDATIRGYNFSSSSNRYRNLELSINATNLNNGLSNSQTMQLRRARVSVPSHPVYREPRRVHRIRPIYSY